MRAAASPDPTATTPTARAARQARAFAVAALGRSVDAARHHAAQSADAAESARRHAAAAIAIIRDIAGELERLGALLQSARERDNA